MDGTNLESIFRVKLPMLAPYKTFEEFIVNTMLLGRAFSIQSGLQQLKNWEDLFAKPIKSTTPSHTNPKESGSLA